MLCEIPDDVVDDCVSDVWARFDDARIRTFLPVLAGRAVQERLRWILDAATVEVDELSLRSWAWATARRLLAEELPRRWAHTQGVARQARWIGRILPIAERDLLVASAWLHDIGYAAPLVRTGMHQIDGAAYLAGRGVSARVCALVAHHAGAAAVAEASGLTTELSAWRDEHSALRDALWYCDMTTTPDGRPTTFTERMTELRHRRHPQDPVIRALDTNEPARAGAVYRTELRLRTPITGPPGWRGNL